jgi:hypothetical protein
VVKGITALSPAAPVLDTSTGLGSVAAGAPADTSTGTDNVTSNATTAADVSPLDAVTGLITGGLEGVLKDLSVSLTDLVSVPSNPTAGLTGAVTSLADVLSGLSSTLTGLVGALPTTLPDAPAIPGIPVITTAAPTIRQGSSSPSLAGGLPKSLSTEISPLLNLIATPGGSIPIPTPTSGSGLPSLPTIQLPIGTGSIPLPSLPVLAPANSAPSIPTIDLPILPASSGTGNQSCTSTPSIPLPLPSLSTGVSLGALGVNVSVGPSTSVSVCTDS